MKNETKKILLSTAMAGIFAAGVSMAKIAPAFADEAGGDKAPAKAKNSCKGSCKSKDGCKGKKKAHGKKKGKTDDAKKGETKEAAPAGDEKKPE
ncbi:MAG: hypothetical protein HY075_03570 [Deltaproteobacteria bacterium]|nr:hypothetical protein [Deltaproteobacteria bacterium]